MQQRCAWVLMTVLLLAGAIGQAHAAEDERLNVAGIWGSKYGKLLVAQQGEKVVGYLFESSGFCPFEEGRKIFTGNLMEDNIEGRFLMCQVDDECGPPVWAYASMLVSADVKEMNGQAGATTAVCPLVGFSISDAGKRGLVFKRMADAKAADEVVRANALSIDFEIPKDASTVQSAKAEPDAEKKKSDDVKKIVLPGPRPDPGTYDPRAPLKTGGKQPDGLSEGKRLMGVGKFEQARKAFQNVLKKSPGNPFAYTGIGATYYARNEYARALAYYKKALAADPNFGMAYYNMACIYALQKKTEMALRYLKIASMNGFVPAKQMQEDPDLTSLRETPEFKKIVSGEF